MFPPRLRSRRRGPGSRGRGPGAGGGTPGNGADPADPAEGYGRPWSLAEAVRVVPSLP